MANWREILTQTMSAHQESWTDVEAMVFVENDWSADKPKPLTETELDREFDAGYGGTEGCYFTVWTKNRVYFPSCYDGAEGAFSVPRNPCDEAAEHVGGG